MEQLPPDLLAVLPESAGPVAAEWWDLLSEADRRRIIGLWDERLEVSFFSPQIDDDGCSDEWEQVPSVVGGRFMPSKNDERWERGPGFFEHLLQHPESVLAYEAPSRKFHVGCTLHSAARKCILEGEVPRDFVCPVGTELCPLLSLRGARLTRKQDTPSITAAPNSPPSSQPV